MAALAAPRIVAIALALGTGFLSSAFESVWIPIVAIMVMPITTVYLAWVAITPGGSEGVAWVAILFGTALFDIGFTIGWMHPEQPLARPFTRRARRSRPQRRREEGT